MDCRFLGKSLLVLGLAFAAAAPSASAGAVPPPIVPGRAVPPPVVPVRPVPAPRPVVVPPPVVTPRPRPVVVPPPVVVREPAEVTEVIVVEKPAKKKAHARLLNGGEFMKLNNLPAQAEILTSPGREIVFAIEENATTGYTWVVGGSVSNDSVAVAVSHNPATNSDVNGAPGNASFRVSAKATGQAVLLLQYKRPGEEKAASSIALRVVVQ